MKTIKALFMIAFVLAITSAAKAQNSKLDGPFLATKAIKVNGVCDMCKHRIENALKNTPGISSASWNIDSKTLLVQYSRAKINPAKIQQMVAAVGHDTEKIRASDVVYNALPDCCHYPRKS
jgi:copper chaperone CopZ